jgi:hypothetical protein
MIGEYTSHLSQPCLYPMPNLESTLFGSHYRGKKGEPDVKKLVIDDVPSPASDSSSDGLHTARNILLGIQEDIHASVDHDQHRSSETAISNRSFYFLCKEAFSVLHELYGETSLLGGVMRYMHWNLSCGHI